MKKFILILIIFLTGCSNSYKKINGDKAKNLIDNNEAIMVDVRTEVEYKRGHVINAILIPYETINKNINLNKDKKIIVYCRSGNRSKKAAEQLINLGYDVYDLGSIDNSKQPIVEE